MTRNPLKNLLLTAACWLLQQAAAGLIGFCICRILAQLLMQVQTVPDAVAFCPAAMPSGAIAQSHEYKE